MIKTVAIFLLVLSQTAFAQLDFSKQEKSETIELQENNFFSLSLTKGFLSFDLPSVVSGVSEFDQNFLGFRVGKKSDTSSWVNGAFEVALEWQSYERNLGPSEQNANIFQIDLLQYFNLPLEGQWWRTTAAFGLTPFYFTAEQSVFSNSVSQFGLMGSLKFDYLYLLENKNEIDLSIKGSLGTLDNEDVFLTTIGLGFNFE
jgi:hypothetical protein